MNNFPFAAVNNVAPVRLVDQELAFMRNLVDFRNASNNALGVHGPDYSSGMNELLDTGSGQNGLAKSGVLTKKEVFRWSLEASMIRNTGFKRRSDFFTFGPCGNSKFYLIASRSDNVHIFAVGLCRVPNVSEKIHNEATIKVSFSLLDTRDRCHHTCERSLAEGCYMVQAFFDLNSITSHQNMFFQNGRLRLHCSLDVDEVVKDDLSCNSDDEDVLPVENLVEDLAADFRKLLESGLYSDVILTAGDQDFPVHRSILAARSTVFAAMFQHDTLEKIDSRVVIEDISSEAMSYLLQFMYTGGTEELDDSEITELLSLFAAADKYNLPRLKRECSVVLCSKMNCEIALNVLVFANLHQDDDLKEAAIRVVLNNVIDITSSNEWIEFLRQYPELANEIILKLATKSTKDHEGKSASLTTNL